MEFYGKLKQALVEIGGVDPHSLILAFASGSWQHGARMDDKADLDVSGVFVGNPEEELQLDNENPRKMGHASASTAGDKRKNTKADVDIKAYSLRRWAGLALKGNPSALSFLFVPDSIKDMSLEPKDRFCCPYDEQQCESPSCYKDDPKSGYYDPTCVRRHREAHTKTVWDTMILPNTGDFLSARAAKAFIGLADNQFHRMLGEGTGKHGTRKAEKEEYGYDPKAAMHMIRGVQECLELLRTGKMTFPRPEKTLLLNIRTGKLGLKEVLDLYGVLRNEVLGAEKNTPLPPECDREKVSKLVSGAILKHWRERKWL